MLRLIFAPHDVLVAGSQGYSFQRAGSNTRARIIKAETKRLLKSPSRTFCIYVECAVYAGLMPVTATEINQYVRSLTNENGHIAALLNSLMFEGSNLDSIYRKKIESKFKAAQKRAKSELEADPCISIRSDRSLTDCYDALKNSKKITLRMEHSSLPEYLNYMGLTLAQSMSFQYLLMGNLEYAIKVREALLCRELDEHDFRDPKMATDLSRLSKRYDEVLAAIGTFHGPRIAEKLTRANSAFYLPNVESENGNRPENLITSPTSKTRIDHLSDLFMDVFDSGESIIKLDQVKELDLEEWGSIVVVQNAYKFSNYSQQHQLIKNLTLDWFKKL